MAQWSLQCGGHYGKVGLTVLRTLWQSGAYSVEDIMAKWGLQCGGRYGKVELTVLRTLWHGKGHCFSLIF